MSHFQSNYVAHDSNARVTKYCYQTAADASVVIVVSNSEYDCFTTCRLSKHFESIFNWQPSTNCCLDDSDHAASLP